MDRQFWITHSELAARPLVMASRRLTPQLLHHLLTNKSKNAVKQKNGHKITPMQAVCSSLVVPLVFPCWINGTPNYRNGKHVIDPLRPNDPAAVIVSALVHPDFEFDNVTMEAIRLEADPVIGLDSLLSYEVNDYELKRQLVYQLTHSHRLPSYKDVSDDNNESGSFLKIKDKVLSLEMLRNLVKIQILLEQKGLETIAQKFGIEIAFTWDPPAIFAREIGYEILDNLFFEAITTPGILCDQITTLAFNDFQNKQMVPKLRKALPHIHVTAKSEIPPLKPGHFKVLHTNGDAFANHVLTQPISTSLDGAIGSISSAAASLCFKEPIINWVQLMSQNNLEK